MNTLTIRELEYFVAVANHFNFSKAAKELHLTQPPLSRQIQSLEGKLGVKLMNRNTHGVALTDAGRMFLEDGRSILNHLDRATQAVQRLCKGETARLRLAFIGALLDEKLVRLIQDFREEYPTCQVQVTDLAPSAQLAALQAGEMDGGFVGARPSKKLKGIEFVPWASEPLLLAIPENHPLAKIQKLAWLHLRNLNWVMVSRGAATAFREQFSALEKSHRLNARILQESDRLPAILTMVAAGNGVTLVPQSVVHLISKGVVFRPLPSPIPKLCHAFAYQPKGMSEVLRAFVKRLGKM